MTVMLFKNRNKRKHRKYHVDSYADKCGNYCKKLYIKGEITVFLSLILAGMLGLLSVLIESARVQLIRMNIEAVMDASLHSCFGEYDQRLFRRYDLLFIDSSYRGSDEPGIDSTARHLSQYLNENTDYTDTVATGEWYREKVTDVNVNRYIFASDNDGEVLKSQACEYISKYGSYKYICGINAYRSVVAGSREVDFFGEWDGLLSAISTYGIPVTNPGEIVRRMVLSEEEYFEEVPLNAMMTGDSPSTRGLKRGNAISKHRKSAGSDDEFIEYMMQKFGCYTEHYHEQQLTSELEYIIYGQNSDRENMIRIIDRLLKMRESDNLSCIKGDAGKVALAEEKAIEVASFNMIEAPPPELIRLIRDSILYAWAYAESAIDVSRLLNKGNCPVNKGPAEVELSLDELLEFRSKLGQSGGEGISYKDYTGIFVSELDDRIRRLRCMDIIEGNFRVFYNDHFRIDGCVEYMEATASFTSGYGYSHEIKRDYIYE